MSWTREIKLIKGLIINILGFIIWSVFTKIIFSYEMNHMIFFLAFSGSLVTQFIYQSAKDKHVYNCFAVIIPSILIGIFLIFKFSFVDSIVYLVYFIMIFILIYKEEQNGIYYRQNLKLGKLCFIICLSSALISMKINISFFNALLRYYVFFLVLFIVLIRESRLYAYNIKDKKSKIYNLGIAAIIIFMSFNKGYLILKNILKIISGALLFLFDKTCYLVLYLFGDLLIKLLEKLEKFLAPRLGKVFEAIQNSPISDYGNNMPEEWKKAGHGDIEITPFMYVFIKITAAILIASILLLVFKRLRSKFKINEEYEETREKINVDMKDGRLKKYLKNIFRSKGDIKEQIRYIFGEFQIKTKRKEIFKSSMTATHLKNAAKAHITKHNELDVLSEVYNEAKFSEHKIDNSHLEKISKSFNEIKKEI